jgi:hypothetical protein
VSWVWRLKNIGEVPHRRVEVEAAMSFLSGWSLALIGNAAGQTFGAERDIDPRRFR